MVDVELRFSDQIAASLYFNAKPAFAQSDWTRFHDIDELSMLLLPATSSLALHNNLSWHRQSNLWLA